MAKRKAAAKKVRKKSSPTVARPRRNSERRFEIEHAADTLVRAEQVRNEPALMKEVKSELARREKAVKDAQKG